MTDQVTVPKKITTVQSARRKLELSQVSAKAFQQELMGLDVGVDKLAVYLSSQIRFDIGDRITDATVSRSIDASTTLTVVINDYDRGVLQSGYLYNKLDVQVDGLWFRLMGVDKSGDELTLTFEDRMIAVLRGYTKWKVALRSQVTRAEFILSMITEVKEFQIPTIIPELHTPQFLQAYDGDTKGIDAIMYKRPGISTAQVNKPTPPIDLVPNWGGIVKRSGVYVGDSRLNQEQRTNVNYILGTAKQMGVNRKVAVSAIMTAIVESNLINLPGGDWTSVGLFQQTDQAPWNTIDRTNPEASSRIYFQHAVAEDAKNPHESLNDLCWHVQQPAAEYRNRYGTHQEEADRIVTAYGITGGNTETVAASDNGSYQTLGAGGEFYFYRGNITNRLGQKVRLPENTWTCIQRLAKDVNWKAFFVSGWFYYISEDDLIKQKPLLTMNEWTDGIISVDGNFYEHKDSATLTITADVGRWIVAPGGLVVVEDMGPWDGRWLVSDFERSLFNTQATITLSRERPGLPEPNPKGGNKGDIKPTWVPKPGQTKASPTSPGSGASPAITGASPALANQLLGHFGKSWFDESAEQTERQQMTTTSAGGLVTPQGGLPAVVIDARVLSVLLWLIEDQGYMIGTSAICQDHSPDPHGHSAGLCVDIRTINQITIGSAHDQRTFNITHEVAQKLHDLGGKLAPRQLITGGYGNVRDPTLTALTIPQPADTYYTPGVMAQHCNHIHVGY